MLLMSSLFITDLSALSASSGALPSLQHASGSRGEMTDKHRPRTRPEPPAAGTWPGPALRGEGGGAQSSETSQFIQLFSDCTGPVYDQTVSSEPEPEPRERRRFFRKGFQSDGGGAFVK